MSAADPEHIAFACLAQLLFDISDTVDRIGSNPLEWHSRGYGACDHCRRKLWFGRKACVGRHVCGFQTIGIVGPFLRKIQRAIDERMAMTRNVGSEDADLAICNLACRTSVLPRHTARRLALLEKAGLVDDEKASASQSLRPRIACCRHGPGSPAASARIQPVLRCSSPSRPSRNRPAFLATRSCPNNGRIRFFTSRSDAAHNASVSSIDAARAHDLRIMVAHGFRYLQKGQL